MRLKGIVLAALALLGAAAVGAMESLVRFPAGGAGFRAPGPSGLEDPLLDGVPASWGAWKARGAELRPGFRGEPEYVLTRAAYAEDEDSDLLLHFDAAPSGRAFAGAPGAAGAAGAPGSAGPGALPDLPRNYGQSAGPFYGVDASRALFGLGAASFRGPESKLSLEPRRGSLFAEGSRFGDFSLEFWLYPANAENGEVILLWRSVRKTAGGALPQQLSCVVASGRVSWNFVNFFAPPEASSSAPSSLELRARTALVPRTWSHHLLRFDRDTGLLEYLVDGRPEAMTHATANGREGGTVYLPLVGAASPLHLGAEFAGLMDEFRLSRALVERPVLRPFGREGAVLTSPVADLGYGNGRLLAVEAEYRAPGSSGIELAYRVSDEWTGWTEDWPAWVPVRAGERLPDTARGRYAQVRVELYPDGGGRQGASLSSLSLRLEPDPPPPPPARLVAVAKDGALELAWTRVPEEDLGGYLVYYGHAPGEYFGSEALEGPSPVDAGREPRLRLSGLVNGRLYYLAVAAYDAAPATGIPPLRGGPASRAGPASPEVSARPSRTAR